MICGDHLEARYLDANADSHIGSGIILDASAVSVVGSSCSVTSLFSFETSGMLAMSVFVGILLATLILFADLLLVTVKARSHGGFLFVVFSFSCNYSVLNVVKLMLFSNQIQMFHIFYHLFHSSGCR